MARSIQLTLLRHPENNYRAYGVSFLALIAGGLIYMLWRENPIVFLTWIGIPGVTDSMTYLRTHTLPMREVIPAWIIYSLPDGLWSFGYALIISRLWTKNTSAIKFFWMMTIPLLCLGTEVMQWVGLMRGVFCPVDLLLSFAGITLGMFAGATPGTFRSGPFSSSHQTGQNQACWV